MPMTPGYYMPQMPYMNTQTYTQMPQSYQQAQQNVNTPGMIWVDGEVGARAYQIPAGWPAGTPVVLWDTNDSIIYLRSVNQMGVPSQLYKIHYTMEDEYTPKILPSGNYQSSGEVRHEDNNYVTKDDMEQLKSEIRDMLKQHQSGNSQGGSQNSQNRGGNR